MRICWPYDLLNTIPVLLTVCFSFIMIVDMFIIAESIIGDITLSFVRVWRAGRAWLGRLGSKGGCSR